jgi:hypothetical protein
MNIKDLNGNEHEVDIAFYRGTAIVAYTVPFGIPVSSRIVLDDGDTRAVMTDIDFRNNAGLNQLIIEATRRGILTKALPVKSGSLFCITHPEHGVNKLMPLMGMKLEVVEDGKWHKWSIPIEKVLSGKL